MKCIANLEAFLLIYEECVKIKRHLTGDNKTKGSFKSGFQPTDKANQKAKV